MINFATPSEHCQLAWSRTPQLGGPDPARRGRTDGSGKCARQPGHTHAKGHDDRLPPRRSASTRARNDSSGRKTGPARPDTPQSTRLRSPSSRAPRAETTRKLEQVSRDFPSARGGRGRSGHDHEVKLRRKQLRRVPAPLSHHSLDSIPDHGVSDLAGDSDTKPRPPRHGRIGRILPRTDKKQKMLSADATAPTLDREELTPLAQPAPRRKTQTRRQGSAHGAETRTRPLLLRDGDRQLLAALAPTAAQDLTACRRLHPLAEPVGTFAALAMGLKCPLHDCSCGARVLPLGRTLLVKMGAWIIIRFPWCQSRGFPGS